MVKFLCTTGTTCRKGDHVGISQRRLVLTVISIAKGSFTIGLAVLIHYRTMADGQRDGHIAYNALWRKCNTVLKPNIRRWQNSFCRGIAYTYWRSLFATQAAIQTLQWQWACKDRYVHRTLYKIIVRENVRNTAKNVKSHDFLDFQKKT